MNSLGYRHKLLLTITAVVVSTLGVALIYLSFIANRQVRISSVETAKKTQQALQNSITVSSQQLMIQTALLANRQGTKGIYQADEPSINDHYEEIRQQVRADWMLLTDYNGKVLGQTKASPAKAGDDLSKSFMVYHATHGKQQGGLFVTESKAAIVGVQPIKVGEYVQAVMVIGRTLDQRLLNDIIGLTGGQAALSQNGHQLVSTVSEGSSKIEFAEVGQPISSDSLTGKSEVTLSSLADVTRIKESFEPIKSALWVLLGLGIAFGVLVGLWLSRSLSQPIEQLVSAFRVLQDGVWPDKVSTSRNDEIGVLQHAFDEMTDSIRTSRERLIRMLDVDPLTELLNYKSFRKQLEERLSTTFDCGYWIGLIDIDHFETFNQAHGTEAGDKSLREIATILQDILPDSAVISRFGGNEFAFIGCEQSPFFAKEICSRIEEKLKQTVSIGLCEINDQTNKVETALLAIEIAATQAKNSGRNRVRVFEDFSMQSNEESLGFLRQSSYAAVKALAEAVDAKDEYTRGHSTRVAEYAKELAEACGYDQGFIDLVYVTGTLHDVGKIGVPDAALKKPGHLTDEEFEMIKLHPALGEKIVRQIPELADTLPGIRGHHERWDGRGYPDQTVGEEIPLLARVLAVADTYDAMTSDRPYRKGLSVEIALDAIQKGAGSQFDPELATVFVKQFANRLSDAA
jgi:diguanylate cyclase (GGDEF)-like protein